MTPGDDGPPSAAVLAAALASAGSLHHEYEQTALGGVRDELWPGFYAAYVLGRVGRFTTAGRLAELLEGVDVDGAGPDWPSAAAARVVASLEAEPGRPGA